MIIIDQYLWFSYGSLCGILVLVAFLNQKLKTFPVFFWLLGWYFVAFLVEFTITVQNRSDAIWLWCILLMNAVSCFLEIAVLYGVAKALLFSPSALATRLKFLRRYVLGGFILLSTILAALMPAPSQVTARRVLMRIWFAQNCVELGLLLTLIVFAGTLAISWKRLHAGVALGWGIGALVNILAQLLLSRLGSSFMLSEEVLSQIGLNICALVWLRYVLRQEQGRNYAVPTLQAAQDLHQQAEKLQVIVRRTI